MLRVHLFLHPHSLGNVSVQIVDTLFGEFFSFRVLGWRWRLLCFSTLIFK